MFHLPFFFTCHFSFLNVFYVLFVFKFHILQLSICHFLFFLFIVVFVFECILVFILFYFWCTSDGCRKWCLDFVCDGTWPRLSPRGLIPWGRFEASTTRHVVRRRSYSEYGVTKSMASHPARSRRPAMLAKRLFVQGSWQTVNLMARGVWMCHLQRLPR